MSYHKYRMRQIQSLAKSFRVDPGVTQEVLVDILQSLDCPRALSVYLLYTSGEHEQLAQLRTDPSQYLTLRDFRDAHAATELLSKAEFLSLPYNKQRRALEKFEEFELLCAHTNTRFGNLALDPLFCGSNVWLLNAVTRKISKILGEFCVDEMFDEARWGPGVTTLLKGDDVSAATKFQYETGTTRDLYALLPLDGLPLEFPGWQRHLVSMRYPTFQVGNKVVTVPKDAKSDRPIAVEPGLNLWFQLGIGKMVERRLLRYGIDLTSQSKNQQLANEGSRTSLLATVDFSSASDSIARNLVREILPPSWFRVMDAVRSHFGLHSGSPRLWAKFSSMGNGFTFPLESLIFFCAADAVAELLNSKARSKISVYGDDVIIPVDCYETFSSFCAFLGFRINQRKSFSSGSFRESCGKHFWEGVDVTPIYVKQIASSVLAVFRLANAVRIWAHRRNLNLSCDDSLRKPWTRLFLSVPEPTRLIGSFGKGDSAFIGNFDESHCDISRDTIGPNQWEGYVFVAISSIGVTRFTDGVGLLFARLRMPSPQESGNTRTLRGRVRIKVHRILTRQWYDLGPWI